MEQVMKIVLKNSEKTFKVETNTTTIEFLKKYGVRYLKGAIVAKLNEELIDLNQPLKHGGVLEIFDYDSDEGKKVLNHSANHVMAKAVKKLFPKTLLGVGPYKVDGFFYDFGTKTPFTAEDLEKIEKEALQIIKNHEGFERIEVTKTQAINKLKKEPYKKELLEEFDVISFYKTGSGFEDLCRGPHIPSTKLIKAFKVMSSASAYWKGDQKNDSMQRIYGVAFPKQTMLDTYLHNKAEAEKRDHRIIGQKLELFTFSEEIGPGLPLWLPKGNILKEELENWGKQTEKEWGYVRVTTPTITKEGLYYTSGHLPYYADSNFPAMELDDGQKYYLKPMNCPHHHMIYKFRTRSYKELPLRLAEYGRNHRYEQHGELHGLFRVRSMDMNDSHIYCTKEQAVQEFKDVIKLHQYYYETLGIKDYRMELALKDPENTDKYHGETKMWEEAEGLMREAMKDTGVEMVEDIGGAAFYGPKVDFQIKTVTGKQFTTSTNQLDLYMPERFDLEYVGEDGKRHMPVVIHRAPLGTHERFIGFLIEHFAGSFPFWLSPEQIRIIPLSEDQLKYANKIAQELKEFRVSVDETTDRFNNKIRKAQEEKIPYMIIVGSKEEEKKVITIRKRNGENIYSQKINDAKKLFKTKYESKDLEL